MCNWIVSGKWMHARTSLRCSAGDQRVEFARAREYYARTSGVSMYVGESYREPRGEYAGEASPGDSSSSSSSRRSASLQCEAKARLLSNLQVSPHSRAITGRERRKGRPFQFYSLPRLFLYFCSRPRCRAVIYELCDHTGATGERPIITGHLRGNSCTFP